MLNASASDPDTRGADGNTVSISFEYEWSAPKVSRPETDNNINAFDWVVASGATEAATYTPTAAEEGNVLRVKVSYTDGKGEAPPLYLLTEFPVRAVPAGDNNMTSLHSPARRRGDYKRTIAENAESGTLLGAPVTATDLNSDVLYYSLDGTDAASFAIDKISGQITVDGPVDFEDGSGADQTYDITVMAHDPSGGDSLARAVGTGQSRSRT